MCVAYAVCLLQGNDDVFSFLELVLDQVVSQFPCKYVHIGGDEVPKARWEECEKCQARMSQVRAMSFTQLWVMPRMAALSPPPLALNYLLSSARQQHKRQGVRQAPILPFFQC